MQYTFSRTLLLAGIATASVMAASCSPIGLAAGAGASAGIAAARDGGISTTLADARIQTEINDLWFRYDVEAFRKLDMTVNQGRVLITGVVQNPEHRVQAVRLAWQPKGVKQVINEAKVAESTGIVGYARDAWIGTRLRSAMILDKQIQSINYSIDVVQGTVYLMGVSSSQAELNRVIETARTIPDVKQVVSYVKLRGSAIEGENSVPAGQEGVSQPMPAAPVDPVVTGGSAAPVSGDDSFSSPGGGGGGGPIEAIPLQ